jgi:hypothetical protein
MTKAMRSDTGRERATRTHTKGRLGPQELTGVSRSRCPVAAVGRIGVLEGSQVSSVARADVTRVGPGGLHLLPASRSVQNAPERGACLWSRSSQLGSDAGCRR